MLLNFLVVGSALAGASPWGEPGSFQIITRTMDYEPFDFPVVHIQKIQDYKIHEQEAMGFSIPYRSTNGWNQFWR